MTDAASDERLRMLIQRVARRIRTNRADGDVGDSQLGVLAALFDSDRSPTELAAHEGVTPPSMNRTLNALERGGLVTRQSADDDARRVRVAITPAGRKRVVATRALRTAWFSQQLAGLTDDERQLLEGVGPVLQRLADG